jgi:hypothetical protein
MFFIVDGTGSDNETEYRKEMANGFCRQLESETGGRYWRGPTLLGSETVDIAKKVVDAVNDRLCSAAGKQDPRIFLAGHSRGGAAVIFAAEDLNKIGVKVEAMFLFDAVDRTLNNRRNSESIPDNVKKCYHAIREVELAFYYSDGVIQARDKVARCMRLPIQTGRRPNLMEEALDAAINSPVKPGQPCYQQILDARRLIEEDIKMKTVMRAVTMNTPDGWTVNFGNCGVKPESSDRLTLEKFMGSHGALGGAPIIDKRAPKLLIESDRAAMVSVRTWMWKHLSMHKVFSNKSAWSPRTYDSRNGR